MKNTMRILIFLLILLCITSCNVTPNENQTDSTETTVTETDVAETTPPEPVLTPANHEISVSDIESILAANEMKLSGSQFYAEPTCHGGHQMRICRTERGDYVAFVTYWNNIDNLTTPMLSEFYIAKIAPDNEVSLLYFGTLEPTASTIHLNIGQDINGDILVTAIGNKYLTTYVLDAETDAVSTYTENAVFTSGFTVGYSSTMFDFENRKIYAFCNGNPSTTPKESADYVMEWFVFDLETMTWNPESTYHIFENLGRHTFVFPFLDRNGGAYIVGNRNNYLAPLTDLIASPDDSVRTFDELRLFHIPDLTSSDNITYTTIQEVYSERGQEGVWSFAVNNQSGGVFVDADGYMHITYLFYKYDLGGNCPDLDPDYQYRHAIYDGMECIFNEQIQMPEDKNSNYRPQIRQGTDGTLYMILTTEQTEDVSFEVYVYKADDALGKTWTLMNTQAFEGVSIFSSSISAPRNGSIQDDVLSCFFYVDSPSPRSVYTFRISLEDGSVSELQNLLTGTDLKTAQWIRFEPYTDSHSSQILHTENDTYAAFVYGYQYAEHSHYNCSEQFCIAKIHEDNTVSILYTGSYPSTQNKYLNITQLDDGKIYVFPPFGTEVCCIDPATDTVTPLSISLSTNPWDNPFQQIDVLINEENDTTYVLSIRGRTVDYEEQNFINIGVNTLDTEDFSFSKRAKTSMLTVDEGYYTNFYSFSDGQKGAYLVASREVDPHSLAEGPDYVGHTSSIKDSLTLFYIPNLKTVGTMESVIIQAPYTAEATDGIWSIVDMANSGDAYMDADGKLHMFYAYYHMDLDDVDSRNNAELEANTKKYYHVVYSGLELVSKEEIEIDNLPKNAAIRVAVTTDGTPYLLVCNLEDEGAKINVYFETEEGWMLTAVKDLGDFTAKAFSISSSRSGSIQDNVIDCIIYANDNDVYYSKVTFE